MRHPEPEITTLRHQSGDSTFDIIVADPPFDPEHTVYLDPEAVSVHIDPEDIYDLLDWYESDRCPERLDQISWRVPLAALVDQLADMMVTADNRVVSDPEAIEELSDVARALRSMADRLEAYSCGRPVPTDQERGIQR